MWAVPPDIDTEVLVDIRQGETDCQPAFWIGCVQKPLVNQQVPGYGSSATQSTIFTNRERREARNAGAKGTNYVWNRFLPSGEKNQRICDRRSVSNARQMEISHKRHTSRSVTEAGIGAGHCEGNNIKSARRESPSKVFGISTPGRYVADSEN